MSRQVTNFGRQEIKGYAVTADVENSPGDLRRKKRERVQDPSPFPPGTLQHDSLSAGPSGWGQASPTTIELLADALPRNDQVVNYVPAARYESPQTVARYARAGRSARGVLPCSRNVSAMTIDAAVYNASRIWKLYGTLPRKEDHTQERPHRRTPIVFVPEEIAVVPRGMMEARSHIGVSIGHSK